MSLVDEIRACRQCQLRFASTATAHAPAPVAWFEPGARILISGQAPGMRVHKSGRPFDDPSGVRLRAWMGLEEATFWDRSRIAIVPMAFCFPGYDAKGSDLPPPPDCARLWRQKVLDHLGKVSLTLLVGGHAQNWHLGPGRVTDRVRAWRDAPAGTWCLPHPSWRNTAWLARNPWFAGETLPALQGAIRAALHMDQTAPPSSD